MALAERSCIPSVESAAAGDNAAHISPAAAMALVMVRGGGVLEKLPTYEALATDLGASTRQLKRTVRHIRWVAHVDLAARGLVPVTDEIAADVAERKTGMGRAHGNG